MPRSRRVHTSGIPGSILLLLLIGFGFAAPASAAEYYVAPDGDDANPGSLAAPWATVSQAAATLVAGDTVFLRAGTYHERLIPQRSGSAGAYITYAAFPGEVATLDGAGFSFNWAGIVDMAGKSYVRISGLRIVNSPYFGIDVSGTCSHVWLDGNTIDNCQSSGIHVYFDGGAATITDIVVDGNTISHMNMNGDQEGISLCGVDRFQVSHNHLSFGSKEGIDAKQGCSNGQIFGNVVHDMTRLAIYVDSADRPTRDIDIFGNLMFACSEGVVLATEDGGTMERVRVYNNVAYDTDNGFAIHGYTTPGTHHKTDIYLVNNTWYRNTLGVQITEQRERFTNLVIRNNVFADNAGAVNYLSLLDSDVQLDHNLFSGGYIAHQGTDAVLADPLFVDPNASPTPDLRLQAGSPAIDQGSATAAPASDLNGIPRPQGSGWDIGAHEYQPAPPFDGGPETDGGALMDGGARLDGGALMDGGARLDGGAVVDGGELLDAGSPDGGAPIDAAGSDAAGSEQLDGGCSCTVGGARHRDHPAALLCVLFFCLRGAKLRSRRSRSPEP